MAKKEELSLQDQWEIPSGQDGPILPTEVANQNQGFALSCLLTDSAI